MRVRFLQLAHAVISWCGGLNHTQNISGQRASKTTSISIPGGNDSTHKVDICDNLVDGAYPLTPTNHQCTGGGTADANGAVTTSFGRQRSRKHRGIDHQLRRAAAAPCHCSATYWSTTGSA
jgi:hypothetical protein